jgi:vancomycin resistance protein YoaR
MKKFLLTSPTIAIVMVFLSTILILAIIYLLFFFPINSLKENTYLGELNLSNLTKEELSKKIESQANKLENQGLNFIYHSQTINIPSRVVAFDSELAYEIFSIDINESVENIRDNQSANLFLKLFPQVNNNQKKIIEAKYHFHEERFNQTLNKLFADYEIEAKNAYFTFNENEEIIIIPEVIGVRLENSSNTKKAKQHLAYLNLEEINLAIENIYPDVLAKDLKDKEDLVLEILEDNKFSLIYNQAEFEIPDEELIKWLIFTDQDFTLNKNKIENYLQFIIAPEINRLAKMPEFNIEEGKVIDWQPGTSGRKLMINESAQIIAKNLLINKEAINLKVEEIFYEEADGLASEIVEIIGTGHSNFAGSPYNRIHNIKLGADTYHGIIIKPGEEFSTLKNLGPVNASSGYLPELVIKDGKTIPEYGGGLCQVSTTLFRTALQAGLPITARQAHSYRVSYYEPAGTDASIYNPWPDLKFLNDTDYHILIQARIEGANLYFDFWSTDDGREVEVTNPVIYNITSPPPTRYIETEDLKPGEKKCTERAINGANTHFDYTVIYPNDEKVEERFYSHYVPWQEVCLIGKDLEDKEDLTENEEELIEDEKELIEDE